MRVDFHQWRKSPIGPVIRGGTKVPERIGARQRRPQRILAQALPYGILAVCALLGVAVLTAEDPRGAPVLPNPRLTPGEVRSVDVSEICRRGYAASERSYGTPLERERYFAVLRSYGVPARDGHLYELDHLVPLCLGGADTAANLWPQPRAGVEWTAAKKDDLERAECRRVCRGEKFLIRAQEAIARDWIADYKGVFK